MVDLNKVVDELRNTLNSVLSAQNVEEAKKIAQKAITQVEEFRAAGEAEFDTLLGRWAKSRWSIPIAFGVVVTLLAIGDLVSFLSLLTFWL